ncbi:hypothetical protein ACELLULO517_18280 [Acidisoma cellulosilytica]|uniref:Polysaccharide biosynthesis protein n=1 Tax=Acidisoma cellulosilyticum TaxID=2802395 RepID=A0A963Z544_9PROT|nr:hypothetical protein [Acidisoma cellulosilyticum]MCB8882200.1 hypothetical protein [Acidisoma cellulosilyticum]
MKIFLQFFSITLGTQLCLAVNQLILLPLQLRVWGQTETAYWLVILAIANLCSVSDVGLRSIGHAQLLSGTRQADPAGAAYFRQIWALTRGIMLAFTAVVIMGAALPIIRGSAAFQFWPFALIVTLSLDTLLIVRGYWLDTLGNFRLVEGLFLSMVACRNALSVVALLVFHGGPAALAYVMLGTGVAAVVAQAWLLRQPRSLGLFISGWPDIGWRIGRVIPLAIADPAATWIRFSLPVMILASMASPATLTTFVAMRALFSLGRQVISQLSRFASIRYAELVSRDADQADAIMGGFILLATLVASAVSCVIIADHGRLLALWLNGGDPRLEPWIALSFAIGAAGNAFQVISATQMRTGKIRRVALCQYIYITASLLAAALGYWSGSTLVYLALLAAQEVLIGVVFMACLRGRLLWVNGGAFLVALVAIALFWLAANLGLGWIFEQHSLTAVIDCLLFGGICLAVVILAYAAIYEVVFGLPKLRQRRP